MNMSEWAKKEVELATKNQDEYGRLCYESALRAYKSLMQDEHSGMSFSITSSILKQLMDMKPLTPIYDTDDIWREVLFSSDGQKHYQCDRLTSLFKDVHEDGSVEYSDVNRVVCVDILNRENTYSLGIVTNVIDFLFPIQMPYTADTTFKVYCEDFLSEEASGDFDIIGLMYAEKILGNGDSKIIILDKFFKGCATGFEEISREEFRELKKNRRNFNA